MVEIGGDGRDQLQLTTYNLQLTIYSLKVTSCYSTRGVADLSPTGRAVVRGTAARQVFFHLQDRHSPG